MSVPIEFDRRYKVNQETVDEMRRLRKKGWSYQKIADNFGVCNHTAYYWCNKEYRKHKQRKNSKRRHNLKKQVKRQVEARRRQWKEYPISYIIDAVTNAKNEYRCKRHKVFGKTIEEWDKILKKYKQGSQKVE